ADRAGREPPAHPLEGVLARLPDRALGGPELYHRLHLEVLLQRAVRHAEPAGAGRLWPEGGTPVVERSDLGVWLHCDRQHLDVLPVFYGRIPWCAAEHSPRAAVGGRDRRGQCLAAVLAGDPSAPPAG